MEDRLTIYKNGTASDVRCVVERWEFQDKAMGEQYVMFSVSSPVPIPFEVGDWCVFRGQRYTLNVEPSCTQKAGVDTHGQAFVYENVKFNSPQDDLTRCTILDVVLTSGEHSAAYGTNYTGSASFTLNCFETKFKYNGKDVYYAPVHALLDCILANLHRLYGDPDAPHHESEWRIWIDDSKCHSDDKVLTFSNWTAAQALAEVHNTFKLDYVVRGKNIIVGDVSGLADIPDDITDATDYVTERSDNSHLFFGYGKGDIRPQDGSLPAVDGMSLFQIKKVSKNDQLVVTRLRAMGSTKNMPYRYYHNHYVGIPQNMFIQNLQLPDTFLPYEAESGTNDKIHGNENRDDAYKDAEHNPILRHVLGESNDAYIDKGDDAASCPEGIREGTARWDGSDSELPEIYPTIEEVNYRELRAQDVPDIDGNIASQMPHPYEAYPNYLPTGTHPNEDERIDEILDIGGDCNVGDGVMTESEAFGQTKRYAPIDSRSQTFGLSSFNRYTINPLFSVDDPQNQGDYILSFTTQTPELYVVVQPGRFGGSSFSVTVPVTITITLHQVAMDDSAETQIARLANTHTINYRSGSYSTDGSSSEYRFLIPDYHAENSGWSPSELHVTETSTVYAKAVIEIGTIQTEGASNVDFTAFSIRMGVHGSSSTDPRIPNAIWAPSLSALYYSSTPFTVMLKDLGFDLRKAAAVDGGDITISMKSGQCAGREFVVKSAEVVPWTQSGQGESHLSTGKKGWKLTLDRVNDDTIYAYFPSANNKILPGDQFVLLNIALPDAYIKAAEIKLLKAATEHLADNCDTKFTFQPSVDDIYLQRNIDWHEANGTPTESVFWRLYAGMKFPFYGIPAHADDPLPVSDITIEHVTIKMGEKVTPQVEVTLNEKLQQSTISRIQTTVDRIYGSVFSNAGVAYATSTALTDSLIKTFGANYFLSKMEDDTAEGNLTMNGDVDFRGVAKFLHAYVGGSIGTNAFQDGMTGTGWCINSADNSMTLDNLTVRKSMRIFDLLVQQVRATGGEIIVSPANGRIKSVTERSTNYYIEIESGESGTRDFGNMFKTGDWVRCQRWDRNLTVTRTYWALVGWSGGSYITLNKTYFDGGVAPVEGDELVLMGSQSQDPEDANRMNAIAISATSDGKPKITIYEGIKGEWDSTFDGGAYRPPTLAGCARAVLGCLDDIQDDGLNPEGYGLYSDNVYLKGKLALSNGTLISEELTDIRSGKIHLSGETTVDNDFFVRNLETIPDTSQDESNKAKVKIEGSLMEVFGKGGAKNIEFGVDENGYAVLKYLDNDGNQIYDLGPNGFRYVEVSAEYYQDLTMYKLSDNPDAVGHGIAPPSATTTIKKYFAKQVGGAISSDTYTTEQARAMNRHYFTKQLTALEAQSYATYLVAGLYLRGGNEIGYIGDSTKDSVEEWKQELVSMGYTGDVEAFDWSVVEEHTGYVLVTPIKYRTYTELRNGIISERTEWWQ